MLNVRHSQIKRATPANVAAAGTDTVLVAGVTNRALRVISAVVQPGGTATDITFNSKGSGASTAISAKFANAANAAVVLPFNEAGWFSTLSGEALTVTTGAGSATGITLTYAEIIP